MRTELLFDKSIGNFAKIEVEGGFLIGNMTMQSQKYWP